MALCTDVPDAAPRHTPRGALTCALVLACITLAAAASFMLTQRQATGAVPAACATAMPDRPAASPHDGTPMPDSMAAEPAALDSLRLAATAGDLDASAALADLLLDRYEQAHDSAALVDALQWLQRDWDRPDFHAFAQIARVLRGPCSDNPLLRMYWLCQQGE